ncbi:hypothetical protein P7K49_038017 [Saguinus oedipus]|uniref:Uncharacterized protein n=1 Tax=Saguinus oedipus TaxID=9490 RepID=A0ABQ9TDG4_SAGOE|nr:hypothetical protein P7K49_038017 [Saguinus oedipus]
MKSMLCTLRNLVSMCVPQWLPGVSHQPEEFPVDPEGQCHYQEDTKFLKVHSMDFMAAGVLVSGQDHNLMVYMHPSEAKESFGDIKTAKLGRLPASTSYTFQVLHMDHCILENTN